MEPGPGAQRQTEFDGGRVQGEDAPLESKARLSRQHRSGPVQGIEERLLQDLKRSCPVGVGQCAPANGTEPESLDVRVVLGKNPLQGPDGIVSADLAEEQAAEPGPTVQGSNALIAVVLENPGLELGPRNQFDNLGKNGVLCHEPGPPWKTFVSLSTRKCPRNRAFFNLLLN